MSYPPPPGPGFPQQRPAAPGFPQAGRHPGPQGGFPAYPGQGGFPQGGFPRQGFPQAPTYGPPGQYPPPPAPKKSSTGMIIGICAGLLALTLLGIGGCGIAMKMAADGETTTRTTTRTTAPTPTLPPTTPTMPPTTPTTTKPPTTTTTTTTKPPTTTTTTPTSTFTPSTVNPGPGPVIVNTPGGVTNPLYGSAPPQMGCGVRTTMPDRASYEARVKAALDCLETYWAPIFAAKGIPYVRPTVHYYATSVQTPCGTISWTANYCGTWDGTTHAIYLSDKFYSLRNEVPTYVWVTLIHEHNHHLQMESGAFNAWADASQIEGKNASQRRIELQATCWEAQQAKATTNLGYDLKELERYYNWYRGDAQHGTTRNLQVWLSVGFRNPDMGACNTWAVDPQYLTGP